MAAAKVGTKARAKQDADLLVALCTMLAPYVGERGDRDQGAEVLGRLLSELRQHRRDDEERKKVDAGEAARVMRRFARLTRQIVLLEQMVLVLSIKAHKRDRRRYEKGHA